MSKIVKFTYKDFEKKITENFKVKEFACKDGTKELYIDIELVEKLQAIREYIDRPIIIVCGYRTKSYNEICGGAMKSKHLTGEAIDFTIKDFCNAGQEVMSPMNDTNIFYLANDLNNDLKIKRIGLYINRATNFIHIDNGEEPLIWINNFNTKEISYYNNVYDYLLNKKPIKVA